MAETFGEKLKFALENRHIKQKELAEMIGVHEVSICRYINNKEMPSTSIIVKICRALGISADWLLDVSDCYESEKGTKQTKERYIRDETLFDGKTDGMLLGGLVQQLHPQIVAVSYFQSGEWTPIEYIYFTDEDKDYISYKIAHEREFDQMKYCVKQLCFESMAQRKARLNLKGEKNGVNAL